MNRTYLVRNTHVNEVSEELHDGRVRVPVVQLYRHQCALQDVWE